MKPRTKKFLWVLGGIFVLGAAVDASKPKSPSSQAGAAIPDSTALQVLAPKCVEAIKSKLHDPASAQFPNPYSDYSQAFQTIVTDGTYKIAFEYRAKNGFNALRKYRGECNWHRDSKGDLNLTLLKSD